MPKLKTQSSCKRRFRITGTGLLRFKNTGKRHGMTKRSRRQIRENRRPDMMNKSTSKFILKKFLSYFKKLRKRSGF